MSKWKTAKFESCCQGCAARIFKYDSIYYDVASYCAACGRDKEMKDKNSMSTQYKTVVIQMDLLQLELIQSALLTGVHAMDRAHLFARAGEYRRLLELIEVQKKRHA